jgi:EAL domain-containing protein (putative c-di-GMP-specific phosphodiesterase class I)
MIPPSIFIPIAEECGLINAIGSWVLKRACQDCMRWQPWLTQPAKVSVNLSARQFIKQDIQQEVAQALQASQLPAELLELELTESVIMEDVEESTKALHSLRHLGVKLAVDDFGTGYSSMAYLKRFPLSSLKIDRSFIIDIADDSDDAAIVAATIALGHSLNLQVVAEGVESQQQLQMLKALGCDTIQGYYLHKPMPIDAIADFIKINANVQH